MSLNALEVRYDVEWFRDTDEPLRPLLAPTVLIDGRSMLDRLTLDLRELVASTHRNGEFWVFTCGCGEPACAGINSGVEVFHCPTEVVWRVATGEYVFGRRAYFGVIEVALARVKELASEFDGDVELGPYGFETEDLRRLSVDPLWD